jgi:hypothetical protein
MEKNYLNWKQKLVIKFRRLWFKFQLNRGVLIKVDDRHRGFGKTRIIIDKAIRDNMAIVVGTQRMSNIISENYNDIKIIRLAKNFTLEIRGTAENYEEGVLIDDSVDPELIPKLVENGFKICGGFINNNKSDK